MTDEHQEDVKSNPENNEGTPNPSENPNLKNEKENPNPENKRVEELEAQIETLKRQYNGSTEEALRLKEKIQELENAQGSSSPTNDEAFNQLVEKVGWAEAVRRVAREEVDPVAKKTDSLYEDKNSRILNSFKANHPGLKDELLDKFDKEFDRLTKKQVYDTVEEALEAAYKLVGGSEADMKVNAENKDKQETQEAQEQSKKDKQQVISDASGSNSDHKATPQDPKAEIKQKLKDLKAEAMTREAQGRDASILWAQIEEMKFQLSA